MINKERYANEAGSLRERAESKAGPGKYTDCEVLTPEQLKKALHELQVHQIELEMQNEELRHTQEELEASRARYFDLYDLAPVGYCTISEKNLIVEANLTLADLLGETRGDLIKSSLSRYIFPADQDTFYTLSRQLVLNGVVQTCELRLINKGNSPFWAKIIVSAYREQTGLLVSHIVISNITDRVLIKDALQKNQEKMQTLFQILPVGLSVLGKDRTVIISNPELDKILAVPGGGKHKNTYVERRYLHADGTPMSPEEFPSTIASRERISVEDVEIGIIIEDGTTIWTNVSAVPVPFDEWDVVVSTTDITRRKFVEEALRTVRDGLEIMVNERTVDLKRTMAELTMEQKRFNNVLEMLPAYVVLLTPDYRVKFANRFFRERFGDSNAPHRFFLTDSGEPCETFKPMTSQAPHHWERIGSDNRCYDIHDVPFTDVDGTPLIMEMGIDITDRKRAESELLDANEMKLLGQLTAGVAHEVRNPLNGILAIMGALSKELSNDDRFEPYMKHMRNQVTRLSVLMDDLLILGRPLHEENLSEIAMSTLVEKNFAAWLQTISLSKASVRLITPDISEPCMIKADTTSMSQVIINLLENAFHHSPAGTEITCSVSGQKKDTVIFSVKDRGTGIPEDILPKIFDPFFTTRKGGTGLGLSIVRRIVENHQGTISACNNIDGPGATFEVLLPLFIK